MVPSPVLTYCSKTKKIGLWEIKVVATNNLQGHKYYLLKLIAIAQPENLRFKIVGAA